MSTQLKQMWSKTSLRGWVAAIVSSVISFCVGLPIVWLINLPARSDIGGFGIVKIMFWVVGLLCAVVGGAMTLLLSIQLIYHWIAGNFEKALVEVVAQDTRKKPSEDDGKANFFKGA